MKIENALPEGYQLHQYSIAKTIGGGGFSIVYLARNGQTGQWVVIKEYLPDKQAARIDGETVETLSHTTASTFNTGMKRFLDEAMALSKINHPNIVRVLDFFRENNTVYMVMNYEDGKDLRWYIKRHGGRLSERFLRTVFPEILAGLDELHRNELLHLDIKPANIFLRPGGKPLLLDFGAAQGASLNNETGPNTLTPGFAPIEQHQKIPLGPWTDFYAFGASMWACITGRAPPTAIERSLKDKLKPASKQFARRYSPQILEIIDWCLQMDPGNRPQSVQAMRELFARPVPLADEGSDLMDYLSRPLKLPWSKS